MRNLTKHYSPRDQITPQGEQATEGQVENSAGGFVFEITDWSRLDRFLILGTEGGTYYISERKLTRDNAKAVLRCIGLDGPRTVARIVEISDAGRAPKNDQALFALALALSFGDAATKKAASEALPRVARIGTHLFQFVEAIKGFRGFGRAVKRAVNNWYLGMDVNRLAYQVTKYQKRGDYSHADLLSLFRPKVGADDVARHALFDYVLHSGTGHIVTPGVMKTATSPGVPAVRGPYVPRTDVPPLIRTVMELPKAGIKQAPALIREHRLPREVVPTEWQKDPDIWEALLDDMPMTAMLRTLNRMTADGLIVPLSRAERLIVSRLGEVDRLKKARVHPLHLLVAQKVYGQGHGDLGSLTWKPSQAILNALDAAFYLAFDAVEPANKRTLIGLDVSGSMGTGRVCNSPLTPREAGAALSLVTMAREPSTHIVGFTSGASGEWHSDDTGARSLRSSIVYGGAALLPLEIHVGQRIKEVCDYTARLPMGRTDCALPMLYAAANGIKVDTFVIITDNETWAGNIHPYEALTAYRKKTGIPSKMVVVGMTATEFSIANPSDSGSLDVVGMDTATPALISDFSAGRI